MSDAHSFIHWNEDQPSIIDVQHAPGNAELIVPSFRNLVLLDLAHHACFDPLEVSGMSMTSDTVESRLARLENKVGTPSL